MRGAKNGPATEQNNKTNESGDSSHFFCEDMKLVKLECLKMVIYKNLALKVEISVLLKALIEN